VTVTSVMRELSRARLLHRRQLALARSREAALTERLDTYPALLHRAEAHAEALTERLARAERTHADRGRTLAERVRSLEADSARLTADLDTAAAEAAASQREIAELRAARAQEAERRRQAEHDASAARDEARRSRANNDGAENTGTAGAAGTADASSSESVIGDRWAVFLVVFVGF
jgi:uncharacterized membrane protein